MQIMQNNWINFHHQRKMRQKYKNTMTYKYVTSPKPAHKKHTKANKRQT